MLSTIARLEKEEGESEQFTLSKMRVYEMMGDSKAAYRELESLSDKHPLDMVYKTMLGNWLMQHDRQRKHISSLRMFSRRNLTMPMRSLRYMIITMLLVRKNRHD